MSSRAVKALCPGETQLDTSRLRPEQVLGWSSSTLLEVQVKGLAQLAGWPAPVTFSKPGPGGRRIDDALSLVALSDARPGFRPSTVREPPEPRQAKRQGGGGSHPRWSGWPVSWITLPDWISSEHSADGPKPPTVAT
jgi:hypothetical protein